MVTRGLADDDIPRDAADGLSLRPRSSPSSTSMPSALDGDAVMVRVFDDSSVSEGDVAGLVPGVPLVEDDGAGGGAGCFG